MPISLNNSNISVQYNTGSSYIIESVKSDVFVRDTVGTTSNLFAEPTVSPTLTSNIAVFTHSGGAENQTPHTIYFPVNTTCDILIVGGGGGGGRAHSGGGGAGSLIYLTNVLLNTGTYTINVGKGGAGATARDGAAGGGPNNGSDSSIFYNGTNIYLAKGGGGGKSAIGPGASGGSGGGGSGASGGSAVATNIPSGSYGNSGGSGLTDVSGGGANGWSGGGGGGANATGGSAVLNSSVITAGKGGNGRLINITGTDTYYAGGGGGGCISANNNVAGVGGLGGGGNGGSGSAGTNASNNTGSGGGGGGFLYPDSDYSGGAGGSGIIIIKVISPTTNKYLFFNYLPAQPTLNYTLTFPTRTMVNFINSGDEVMNGQYTVSVRTTQSTITPTQGQFLKNNIYSTSNLSARYHLLNPIRITEGAQWTYSSNNPNVYYLGNVGIGTANPEYTLDVRGSIYSSIGGYTQSGLTTWSITSDRRIKENIVKASYEKCLENVNKIELYNFNFKDNCVNTNDKHQLGFIAQEVREVYPKAVEVNKMILNTNETIDDILTLNTTQIDYTLYGAVKNLIEKIDNIDIGLENLGSNIIYNKDLIRNTSNIFSIITSNISITTSNILIGTSNISITTSNISIKTSNIFIGTSKIPIETSNIPIETSNISIDTSNISIYTSNIPFDTSNIPITTSNISIN